jgi:hypothetical protein
MGLRGGLLQALALPVPGQEFVDPLGRVILQAGEDVGEPSLRVNVVERASVKHVSLPPFVLHARRDGESAILAGVTPLRLARVRHACNRKSFATK